jgi:hypothetical protein
MLRIKPRALAAAFLVLVLQLAGAVSAVQARPAAAQAPAARETAGRWLGAALAWLDPLLPGSAARPAPPAISTATMTAGPLTGSCIDPQGNRPCAH